MAVPRSLVTSFVAALAWSLAAGQRGQQGQVSESCAYIPGIRCWAWQEWPEGQHEGWLELQRRRSRRQWRLDTSPANIPEYNEEGRTEGAAPRCSPRAEAGALDKLREGCKEHTRFLRDMARLRDDHQKAVAAQAGARTELLQVFYSGGAAPEPASAVNVEGLMQSWRTPPEETDVGSLLQRAAQAMEDDVYMRGADRGLDPAGAPATPSFGHPPPGLSAPLQGLSAPDSAACPAGHPSVPANAGAPLEYCASAARDPYMTSPSSTHAVPGHPSPSQHYKAPDGSRVSVKTRRPAPAPDLGGVPLGSKLDARRVAMAPFGVGPPLASGHGHTDAAVPEAAVTIQRIQGELSTQGSTPGLPLFSRVRRFEREWQLMPGQPKRFKRRSQMSNL